MFNKKRIVVAVVFILFMFCFITFAGGTPQNQAIATRNVTFKDSYNNAELSAQRVIVGEDALVPENPRHGGLVFVGWFLESDRETEIRDFTNIIDDITVVALYGADLNNNGVVDDDDATYTVTFVDSTNNAVIATRTVLVGMAAVPPTAPVYAGLTFTGWDAPYTNVRSNLTINAVYRDATEPIVMHTVTFIDGLDDSQIAVVTVEDGLTVTAPTAPTHEGYVFVRWDGNLDEVTEDSEIRGIYAIDSNDNGIADDVEDRYTVSYYSLIENTKNEAPKYDNSFLTGEEYEVLENTFVLDNHVFLGWTKDEELASTIVEEDIEDLISAGSRDIIEEANVVYYAVWALDENNDGIPDYRPGQKYEVTITYGVNGETSETKTVLKGTKYNEILPSKELVDPTDEDDYAFLAWVIVEGINETSLENVDEEITSDVNIKATYAEDKNHNGVPDTDPSENHYDVTFKTDSKYATLMGDDDLDSYTVSIVEGALIGDVVPAIKEVATDQVAFDHWGVFDGLKYIPHTVEEVKNTVVTSDMEFTAIFGKDGNSNGTVDIYEDTLYLTIEYVNANNGKKMFDDVKLELVENEGYKVESPVPEEGVYNITPKTVTGTMTKEANGTTITVTYTPNKDDNNNGIDDSVDTYFDVTFKDYDGTTLKVEKVLIGMDATAPTPSIPTEEGYTYAFTGWDKALTNIQESFETKPNYNKETNTYVVTYNVDGTLTTENVKYGETLNAPVATKRGHTFNGWFKGTNKFDVNAAFKETTDVTLIAKFTPNTYTVTYDVDGVKTTEEVVYGNKLNPTTPTKTGYDFTGWYKGTFAYDVDVPYSEERDITLVANFAIKSYEVALTVENGTADKYTETVDYMHGTTFTLVANPKYTVDRATVTCTNAASSIDGSVLTVSEVTEAAVCTVTLQTDARTVTFTTDDEYAHLLKVKSELVDIDSTLKKSGITSLIEEDTTDGIAFDKWLDEDGNVISEEDILNSVVTKDVTYRAVFGTDSDNNDKVDENEKVTVNFVLDDTTNAVIQGDTSVKVFPSANGTTVEFPEINITNEAYEMTGWYDENGKKFTSIVVKKGDNTKTFTAKIRRKQYTVKFYDYVGGRVVDTKTVLHGDSVSTVVVPTKASTSEFDYAFASWDKELNNVTSNLDVYATYTETRRSYTVRYFDYYGNEIEGSLEVIPYGTKVTVPTPRKDYTVNGEVVTFISWSSNSSKFVEYDLEKGITGDLNLYAKYRKVTASKAILYGLEQRFIRQEEGGDDDRGHFSTGVTIDIKDDLDGTLASIMATTDKGKERKLAVGKEKIKNYLTEESLQQIDPNYDIYVLKYCVDKNGDAVWHLDYQYSDADIAVYREGEYGLKIVSSTHTVTSVTRYANNKAVETKTATVGEDGNYHVDGFGIKITDTLNGAKFLTPADNKGKGNYYLVNYDNGKTRKFYWDIYYYNKEGFKGPFPDGIK